MLNTKNLGVLDEIIHPDFRLTDRDIPETSFLYKRAGADIEDFRKIAKGWIDAFSDFHLSIIRMIAVEDAVVAHYVAEATHDGRYFGIQPTGKRCKFLGFHLFTMKEGLIQDIDFVFDSLSLFSSIGHAVISTNETERIEEYFRALRKMGLLPNK